MLRDGRNRATVGARSSTVLLISDDPIAAALLGLLTELAGYVPAFAAPGERPEDALARVRPLCVVLLDGALDSASSDLFFARAAKRQVGLALFGAPGQREQLAARAGRRSIPWLEMPVDLPRFREVLETARGSEWWRGGGERRRTVPLPQLSRGSDGTLIYTDRAGRRWYVYDRRGADRRETDRSAPLADPATRPASDAASQRLFVNEHGEAWHYPLAETERSAPPSPTDLERQLAQATKV